MQIVIYDSGYYSLYRSGIKSDLYTSFDLRYNRMNNVGSYLLIDSEDPKSLHRFFNNTSPRNYTRRIICTDNFKICFTQSLKCVLFRAQDKEPTKDIRVSERITPFYKEWEDGYHQFGPNKKYISHGYKFPKNTEYINPSIISSSQLLSLIPEYFEGNNRKYLNSYTIDSSLEYSSLGEYLWSLGIIDLNNSWDYSEETKKKIKIEKDKKEKKPIQRKLIPGHCSICGCEGASLVEDPFDREMHGYHNLKWLCPRCYDNLCGDI